MGPCGLVISILFCIKTLLFCWWEKYLLNGPIDRAALTPSQHYSSSGKRPSPSSTILDAPVILVALIAHICESQHTSIATVDSAQGVDALVFERTADIAAFGNAAAGVHRSDWPYFVLAGTTLICYTADVPDFELVVPNCG
jgi:hypothetical protein